MPRKPPFSNIKMHSSTTSRNGANSRRSTCLECSTSTPPTWNLRGRRKQSHLGCGCPRNLRTQPNGCCFALQMLLTARRRSNSDSFRIPLMNSVGHDALGSDLSCFTRSSLRARVREHRRNSERSYKLLKIELRNPSDVTVLHGRHYFD